MIKIKDKGLINLIFFLTLFPYFKYIPFIDAEVQPMGAAVAVLYFIVFNRKLRIQPEYLLYFWVLTAYLLISLLLPIFIEGHTYAAVIESISVLLAPLFIFMVFRNNMHLLSTKLLMVSMTAWAVLGTIQTYTPFILEVTKINLLMNFVISRWNGQSLSNIDRGATMFSSEPSYAAYSILFMFIMAIFFRRQQRITRKQMIYSFFLFLWMVTLNKSGTLLVLTFIFALPYILKWALSVRYMFITIPLIILGFIFVPDMYRTGELPRSVLILTSLLSSFTEGTIGLSYLLEYSQQFGSLRLKAMIVGYYNIFLTHGLGSGLGSWSYLFPQSMMEFGFSQREAGIAKPFSYVSLVAYDMGIAGVISVSLVYLKIIALKLKSGRLSVFSISCLILSLFSLYFSSLTSLPIFWLVLLMFYKDSKVLKTKNEEVKTTAKINVNTPAIN